MANPKRLVEPPLPDETAASAPPPKPRPKPAPVPPPRPKPGPSDFDQHFPPEIVKEAQSVARAASLPSSVVLAQAALETAYFKHYPPDSHNLLGIKALAHEPHVDCETREDYGGKWVTITARFKKFSSFAECFAQWARLINNSSLYAAAKDSWARQHDAFKVADLVALHWATDPGYATKVRELIAQWGLVPLD